VVEEGLKGGETLVVQGVQNARPGAVVRVVPSPETSPSPSQDTGRSPQ
jgi:membrane fusion protein (multidrug efflux system)